MIRLETDTPQFFSDIGEVVRLFWPGAEISLEAGDQPLCHAHAEADGQWIETWSMGGRMVRHAAQAVRGGLQEKRMLKRAVKTGCFLLMRALTGHMPMWGSLTGIRPTRLLYEARESGRADAYLTENFYVSEDRVALLSDILSMQKGLIEREKEEYDVYIGIPFCVTRCTYCSFSSGEVGDGHLVEPYIRALEREIALCAGLVRALGLRARACYMGGGTPTALNGDQLGRVLDAAQAAFPGAREWTVEAGRPDTIDEAKLAALRARGVDRISVNPQTFSDETLRRIGRAHTAQQTIDAFQLARSMGFEHINMDLIAALPGERARDFARTLDRVIELNPQSVTVHTLAIKRSSQLHEAGYEQADAGMARQMVDAARARLTEAGYRPYYLYRQKYMADNLENVGYAKPGKVCVYNIDIMEETAPILALGAGAITKWLFPREKRIERAANVKNIEQYIARVEEMFARKEKLIRGEDN